MVILDLEIVFAWEKPDGGVIRDGNIVKCDGGAKWRVFYDCLNFADAINECDYGINDCKDKEESDNR